LNLAFVSAEWFFCLDQPGAGAVTIRIRLNHEMAAISVVAISLFFCWLITDAKSGQLSDDAELSAAICPIVYPLDQFPSAQGSRYLFYGNAFFINEQGYLVTAAHVLSAFRNGGRPHILVGHPGGSHHLLEAALVAEDWEHDVAVLRATPNPFQGDQRVAFLSLATEEPPRGKAVLGVALRPANPEDANTSEGPLEERSRGEVLDYQFTRGEGGADSELLLLSQQVVPGHSGSPVISADSHEVVGIVVGRWLRPRIIPFGTSADPMPESPGAALRIHYAIALLRERGISWHSVSDRLEPAENSAQQSEGFIPPGPLSLVATPYPPQALLGGEVLLDALIDAKGKLADLRVVQGQAPFLEAVLGAVHTWSFLPARSEGRAIEARLGIIFQFPQSFLPPLGTRERKYEESLADSADRAPLPIVTVEPNYPPNSTADGSIVLYEVIGRQGEVTSTEVLHEVESLTAPTVAALRQWRFVPGKQAGANTLSAVAVVVTFRRAAVVTGGRATR